MRVEGVVRMYAEWKKHNVNSVSHNAWTIDHCTLAFASFPDRSRTLNNV